jgi:hypothetical protein
MNSRNEFLHGNIDPKQLSFDKVWFDTVLNDQIIPLFADDRGMIARYIGQSLKFVEPDVAIKDLETARQFVLHVLDHLDADAGAKVNNLMELDYLALNEATGEITQAFSNARVENTLIAEEP